jgi:hypothetical protein
MKKTPGKNIVVSKPALRYIIRALPDQEFKINWKHSEKYSILKIQDYQSKQISEATFINGKNFVFQHLESSNPKVISVFEDVLGITLDHNINKSYKTLYLEIDYHLMELHEYIQAKDSNKINQSKTKLFYLREEILNLQSSKEHCDDSVSIN